MHLGAFRLSLILTLSCLSFLIWVCSYFLFSHPLRGFMRRTKERGFMDWCRTALETNFMAYLTLFLCLITFMTITFLLTFIHIFGTFWLQIQLLASWLYTLAEFFSRCWDYSINRAYWLGWLESSFLFFFSCSFPFILFSHLHCVPAWQAKGEDTECNEG